MTIYPEMLMAGHEAYIEARRQHLDDHDIVLAVFLAMRVVEEMAILRTQGTLH